MLLTGGERARGVTHGSIAAAVLMRRLVARTRILQLVQRPDVRDICQSLMRKAVDFHVLVVREAKLASLVRPDLARVLLAGGAILEPEHRWKQLSHSIFD